MIEYDSVALTTNAGRIVIPIKHPKSTDKFVNRGISGLGPPPVDVFTTSTMDPGVVQNGTHAQGREIVLTIGMNPWIGDNGTFASIRSELYSVLSGNHDRSVIFGFAKEGIAYDVATVQGSVSMMEVDMSTADPLVQITIQCGSSFFQSAFIEDYTVADYTLTSSTYKTYGLEYDNTGRAPMGVYVYYKPLTAFTNGTVKLYNGPNVLTLTGISMSTSDYLTMNSNVGQKRVELNGVSAMHRVSAGSRWPLLASTSSNLYLQSPVVASSINTYITPLYWGV